MAAVSLVTCMAPALAHAATDAPADLKAATALTVQQNAGACKAAFEGNGSKSKSYANKAKVKNLTKPGKAVALYVQRKKASGSVHVVSTPYYKVTIPKAWRGKVQWITTSRYAKQRDSSSYRNIYTGRKFKVYHTAFYLKGHKNDQRYWIATIGGERSDCEGITGFGESRTSVREIRKGKKFIYLLASNMPYVIAQDQYSKVGAAAKPLIPNSIADQKAMLKLVAGNKITYRQARALDYYDGSVTSAYKRVVGYLKPKFNRALKGK